MKHLLTISLVFYAACCFSGDWKPLFNGKDLTGWSVQCRASDKNKQYWTVDNGCILLNSVGDPDHHYVWLMSDGEYADFHIKLKFQAHKGYKGNSGVQIRSRYDQQDEGGWLNGPQLDIHPPTPMRAGLIYDESRGNQRWIFPSLEKGNHKLPKEQTNPNVKLVYGENTWNTMEIIAEGMQIKCIVNGEVTCDYDGTGVLDDDNHKKLKVGMKGHFALQLHAKSQLNMCFKDIKIREL